MRRENRSRDENGQNRTGQGRRDHEQANKGPSVERPSREGGQNRQRKVGIDGEEHTRVAKGKGGRGARGARGVGARANVVLMVLDALVGALEMKGAEEELGREMTVIEGMIFLATGERPLTFEECVAAGHCV